LNGFDSTYDLLREHEGEFPRTLTLAVGARMLLEDLGPGIKRFCESHPHVHLRLLDRDAKAAAELVAAGEADLGLGLEPGPGVLDAGVATERAYRIEYMAVFPKRHSLARKSSLSLAELAEQPLIVGHTRTPGRQLLDQAFHRAGLRKPLSIVAETDNSACTIACVQAGMGVGVVAGRATGVLCRTLATRSLRSQLGDAWIAFLSKRGTHLTLTVQSLIRCIRDTIERPKLGR
jgi:DNA-binding transcriptional LysR family regulator